MAVLRIGILCSACTAAFASVSQAKSLLGALSGSGLDVSQQVLKSALEKAAASEGVSAADLTCLRDYSECPRGVAASAAAAAAGLRQLCMLRRRLVAGATERRALPSAPALRWLLPSSAGLACVASAGACLCSHVVPRPLRLTLQDRAQACTDLEFPCVGECTPDFSQPCPAEWALDGAGSCVAPAGYAGSCTLKKNFMHLGVLVLLLLLGGMCAACLCDCLQALPIRAPGLRSVLCRCCSFSVAASLSWCSLASSLQWPCRQSLAAQLGQAGSPQTCAASFQEACPAE